MLRKLLTSTILSLVAIGGFFVSGEIDDIESFLSISSTLANGGGGIAAEVNATQEDVKKMINGGIVYMNGALEILTALVSPAIFLASWLMTPDWTAGDLFNIRSVLHKLWVMVSNVTYFIYAILLIFIALATIFNSQTYGYKQLLPKLALGIILVPLTWWFVQFIISLSTVVTASVINIPLETVDNYMKANNIKSAWWENKIIQPRYTYFSEPANRVYNTSTQIDCKTNNTECIAPKDLISNASGMYSALLVYGHGIFKIGELKELPKGGLDSFKTATGILHSIIIGALMFLVFGLLVLALLFMLFMRAIKLWFYAMFSPIMTLKYVLGDGIFGGKENSSGFDIKEFIGLAFVPALVGLALSFGLMIVTILQSGGAAPNNPPCNDTLIKSTGCVIGTIGGISSNQILRKLIQTPDGDSTTGIAWLSITTLKFGNVEFEYYGTLSNVQQEINTANGLNGGISAFGGMFGTLIIDFIALIFIWTAFMAAKNVSAVTRAAVAPFEDMGKKIGGFAKTLPKYTPLPLPGGSIAGAQKTMDLAENAFKKTTEERTDRLIGKQFPGLMKGIFSANDKGEIDSIVRDKGKLSGPDALNDTLRDLTSVLARGEKNQINQKDFSDRTANLVKGRKDEFYELLGKKGISDSKEKDLIYKLYTGVMPNEYERNKAIELNQKAFGKSGTGSGSSNNSNSIEFTINGNDKYTFVGSGFNLKDKTAQEILTELDKNPKRLMNLTDTRIKEVLLDMGINLESINSLLEKIGTERNSPKGSHQNQGNSTGGAQAGGNNAQQNP